MRIASIDLNSVSQTEILYHGKLYIFTSRRTAKMYIYICVTKLQRGFAQKYLELIVIRELHLENK